MSLNFTTGKLPTPLISLAYLLLAIGIWRIFILDYLGIIFLVVSIFLLFTKSGVIVDTKLKKLKKYTSFIFIKKGKWEDMLPLKNLIITKILETQNSVFLSFSRTDKRYKYKLAIIFADKKVEILRKADYNAVKSIADELASELDITITDKTTAN